MFQFTLILKAAMKSLMKNRMRSLLTSLGIIIGVSAVIVMVGIGEGSQRQIESQINALGTNLIVVFPSFSRSGGVSHGAGSFNRLTMDDVEKINQETTLLSGVSPVIRTGGQVIGGAGNWNTTIYGVNTDYFKIRNWELESGSEFTERANKTRSKVALLGKTVADQLFPNQEATGQKIRIRNIPFTVIGVLKSKGQNGMGQDQDDVILAPASTVLYRLKGRTNIDMINASAISTAQLDAAMEQIRTVIRRSHRIESGDDDDFNISNQAEITDAVTSTSKVMTMLLGSIAGVSLIVGGIGIMNIMLVSVTERTREIGIRLSVGARGADVMIQFMAEAIVLSVAGGIIGVLLSFGITWGLSLFTSLTAVIEPFIIMLSVVFSAAVGIFFGFYPARKAAGLNPIDALRYE
ncbi:MAG: multidrug ABC transporter substrate-binding protein [Candidatus Marinimicrobia bacterium CG_4_9_14_3_um_filter_48_9]|nr:MAG: multidrug ABC transporter substrate-binding protein [Candidatus Marinimicrobia bacterium CG_4_9_14_3_um_filter_48_9]